MSISGEINTDNVEAKLLTNNLSALLITKDNISAQLIHLVVIESGVTTPGDTEVVTVIQFTSNDLVNGQLIRLHGLNRRVVSVTVTNPAGIEFNPRINNLADNTRVLIDLQRFNIQPGETWYATIR